MNSPWSHITFWHNEPEWPEALLFPSRSLLNVLIVGPPDLLNVSQHKRHAIGNVAAVISLARVAFGHGTYTRTESSSLGPWFSSMCLWHGRQGMLAGTDTGVEGYRT